MRTLPVTVPADCPLCGKETTVHVEALFATGTIPRGVNVCKECHGHFLASATLDVWCEPIPSNPPEGNAP